MPAAPACVGRSPVRPLIRFQGPSTALAVVKRSAVPFAHSGSGLLPASAWSLVHRGIPVSRIPARCIRMEAPGGDIHSRTRHLGSPGRIAQRPMKLVKRFSRINALELVARSLYIEGRLQGHAQFTALADALLAVAAKRESLEASITAAADGGRTLMAMRDNAKTELKDELDKLATAVASIAGKNEELILEAGFFLPRSPRTQESPPMPLNLRARIMEKSGEARLDWSSTPGASIYMIEHNGAGPLDAGAWKHVSETTRIKQVVTGLSSATVHWFRVRAIGSKGRSPWSEVAHTLVR